MARIRIYEKVVNTLLQFNLLIDILLQMVKVE